MEHKGIKGALLGVVFLQLASFTVLFFLIANQPEPKQVIIKQVGTQGVQGRIGDPGLNGKDGISLIGPIGQRGLPGESGTVTSLLQPVVVQGQKGDKGESGEQGVQGEPGQSGQTPEVRVENCQLQTKYPDDDRWQNKGEVCSVTE